MRKMWIALIVTNAAWAGIAVADNKRVTWTVAAGFAPDGSFPLIEVDKAGHVICAK